MNTLFMRPFLTFLSLLLLVGSGWAQEPVVDQLIDPISLDSDGTTLTIVFDDLREDATTNFEAQHSANIKSWTGVPSGTVTPHATIAHRYVLTAPDPGTERKFYRVVGYSTTAEDSDGDGLSNTFEGTLGTLSNRADTDGDGFDDGTEFANGTDPNLANSFPTQATLPVVAFEASQSPAYEGDGTHSVPVLISPSYSGTLYYTITDQAARALDPVNYTPVSGTVSASGDSATITFPVTDDLVVSPLRLFFIDLSKNPPGNAYRPAGKVTHTVCLFDNDAYWSGTLIDAVTQRNFRVRILQNASTKKVAFVSGTSDGLITNPDGESQSTGIIPDKDINGNPTNVFEDASAIFSLTNFSATTPALPAEAGGFLGNVPLKRTLSLTADTTDTSHSIRTATTSDPTDPLDPPPARPNEILAIRGSFTETISHRTNPDITYLDAVASGFFTLTKDLPRKPALTSPFVSN